MNQLQLIKAFSRSDTYMGSTYYKSIVVKSSFSDNQVYIHYLGNDSWKDIPMILTYTNTDFCIWEFHDTSGPMGGGIFPKKTEFALFADTKDGRIWDNNGGNNYSLGTCDGPLLGRDTAISLYQASMYPISNAKPPYVITGGIMIRNLGFQKNVTVYYNGIAWHDTCKSFFSKEYTVGAHDVVISPNVNNCEMFRFTTSVCNLTSVELHFTYEINGQMYIDDNFGQKYVINLQKSETEKSTRNKESESLVHV